MACHFVTNPVCRKLPSDGFDTFGHLGKLFPPPISHGFPQTARQVRILFSKPTEILMKPPIKAPVSYSRTVRMLAVIITLTAGSLIYWSLRVPEAGKQQSAQAANPSISGAEGASQETAGITSAPGSIGKPGSPSPEADAPAVVKTKRADRGVMPDRSKLPVVDLMKSSSETPAWPDGPQMFAEVSSETKRFINLRPNNVGIMPTVNIGTEESVAIRLDFPEGAAGDRIFLELVDGGYFLNTDKPGQVLTLDQSKKLEVSISSDDRVGDCKLFMRQSGHTRVLPFWVGSPLPLAQSDQN